MDMNLNNAQIFFSAGFIFAGVIVFYVAALISGNDIYRDLEFQHSSMLSIAIGAILFLMVPIGYVIFAPKLFNFNLSSDNIVIVAFVHKILFEKALLPFVLIATGFGIIFGSATVLKSRWEILKWLRKYTGVSFCVTSYDFAWDHFMMKIKKHTKIAVELKDKSWIKGYLVNFSIKKEPKQLVLEGYQITTMPDDIKDSTLQQWLEKHEPTETYKTGEILITETAEITKFIVRNNGLRKHGHKTSHTTQASYCSLLALGFLLLTIGFHYACDDIIGYIDVHYKQDFDFLRSFYCYVSRLFCFLSISSIFIGMILMKSDYPNLKVAMILNPFVTFSFGFLFFAVLFEMYLFNEVLYQYQIVLQLVLLIGLLLLSHFYLLCCSPIINIKSNFFGLYHTDNDKFKGLFERVLTYLDDEMDLNNSNSEDEYERIKGLLLVKNKTTSDEDKKIAELLNRIDLFATDKKFGALGENAKLNIVIKLEKYCTLWGK